MNPSLGKDIYSVVRLQILFAATGFLTQIFLARHLGPGHKGTLDLFILIPTVVASLIDLGLLSSNTYFAGKRLISNRILHSHTLLWSLISIAVLLMAYFGFRSNLASVFPNLTGTLMLFSVLLAGPMMYIALWSALMYGMDRVRTVYRLNAVMSFLMLVVYVIIGLVFQLDLMAFLYVTTAFVLLKSILALLIIDIERPRSITLDAQALKSSLTYGIALYLGLIVNTLLFRIDQFFVNSMLGPAQLGIYALAVRIAEMVWLLDFVIINASIFRITSADPAESARITQRMTRMIGSMVAGLSLVVALVAPVLVPLLFGKDFSPAVLPLILLVPGVIGWSLARSLAQFIAYQVGKPWLNTQAAVAAFVLNVILNFVFIPMFGVAGASIASSVSYLSNLVLLAFVFRKLSGAKILPTFIPQREDLALLKQLLTDSIQPVLGRKG